MINFGEKLQQLRTARGITQKEMEEKTGIPQNTISSYENNKVRPSWEVLEKISEFLDVEVADFFMRSNGNHLPIAEDPLNLLPKDEKEIILDYRAIPRPDQKKTVREVVKSFSGRI